MLDIKYLCIKISDMAGLPVRVYRNEEEDFFYCFIALEKDPASLYKKEFFQKKKHIDYLITDSDDCYGILNSNEYTIVIGPSFSSSISEQQLRKLAFDLKVAKEKTDAFISALRTLVPMPLSSILQILCTLNYVFNNEKSSLSDLESQTDAPLQLPEKESSSADVYRSIHIENKLCTFIENGDIAGFESWLREAPTIREGKIAEDSLRQKKNIFIVSATLFSRAAIAAGIDPQKALQYSDACIRQCENISTQKEIANLQLRMLRKYIADVAMFKEESAEGELSRQIYTLVHNNISNSLSTAQFASALGYSRSRLSTLFKKENGMDLKDYILKIKMDEAKRLLKESDNSLSSISFYLGFSSPSHFSNVFHKYTGTCPKEYRLMTKNHQNRSN